MYSICTVHIYTVREKVSIPENAFQIGCCISINEPGIYYWNRCRLGLSRILVPSMCCCIYQDFSFFLPFDLKSMPAIPVTDILSREGILPAFHSLSHIMRDSALRAAPRNYNKWKGSATIRRIWPTETAAWQRVIYKIRIRITISIRFRQSRILWYNKWKSHSQ